MIPSDCSTGVTRAILIVRSCFKVNSRSSRSSPETSEEIMLLILGTSFDRTASNRLARNCLAFCSEIAGSCRLLAQPTSYRVFHHQGGEVIHCSLAALSGTRPLRPLAQASNILTSRSPGSSHFSSVRPNQLHVAITPEEQLRRFSACFAGLFVVCRRRRLIDPDSFTNPELRHAGFRPGNSPLEIVEMAVIETPPGSARMLVISALRIVVTERDVRMDHFRVKSKIAQFVKTGYGVLRAPHA